MPKTKLTEKVKTQHPDFKWFRLTCKSKMLEKDTWYQELERNGQITRSAQAIRKWVEDPAKFRIEDMVMYLKALEFTPEEIGDIASRLAVEMAGGEIS